MNKGDPICGVGLQWQYLSLSAFLGALAMTGKAMAQGEFDLIPPVIADIMVKTGVIVDGVLGTWVSPGNITQPRGEDIVA